MITPEFETSWGSGRDQEYHEGKAHTLARRSR